MAKYVGGALPPTGTFGNVTVYKMWGNYYMRSKSSLARKRVLKSKAFEKTRVCAGQFGQAQRIGSAIYQALPADIKERWLFRAIAGEAASLLYKGKTEQEARDLLWKKYITDTNAQNEKSIVINGKNMNHSTLQTNKQLRELFQVRWTKQGGTEYFFKRAWQKRGYFSKERFREGVERMEEWRFSQR